MSDTAQSGGSDGFFSDITDSFKSGIKTIGSEVLPIWAKSQLIGQTESQLNRDTVDQSRQAPSLNEGVTQQTSSIIKNFPVATILLVAAGVGLTIFIVKANK